ncbi:MAG: hypothetical protein JXC31_01790 [Acholeplasmataceae bacterium]|nr:hypothetical protein [Acholeplasmataceae bacterium]
MHHNIIKDTINLDKKARENVNELAKKKEHLDDLIKEETQKLHQSFLAEIEQKLKETRERYEQEVIESKKKELDNYKKTLKNIQKQYEDNKDLWIEQIFQACIK